MSNTQLRAGDKVIYTMSHSTFRATIVDIYIDNVGVVVKLVNPDGAFSFLTGNLLKNANLRPAPSRAALVQSLKTVHGINEFQVADIMSILNLHGVDI